MREKTGRPKGINIWTRKGYLDLERRGVHIPDAYVQRRMLADDLEDLVVPDLPEGIYGADGDMVLGFNSIGNVTFCPVYYGDSKYGLCVYAGEYSVYGEAVYGDSEYL